ncbi:MAG: radical SAM family heme chaperone HemW [Chthoniobacterales bacterium]
MHPVIRHLYVHIPFCARICPYCAFYKTLPDAAQASRFCEALLREAAKATIDFDLQPETIFFGGGTPTALSTAQLERLGSGLREAVELSHLREWTIEANPGSVSRLKAEMMRALGVTRVSLGVQSWNDDLLTVLGREHTSAQAEASFLILREAGFPSVNIDLMFGLPGQTLQQWETTLARTIALRPDHVSTYCLTYEEDTDFFRRQATGEYRSDSEADAEFFKAAMQMLGKSGYEHYETSNYAQAGHASIHNRAYWAGADYLGIGPSAFSTVGNQRWQNVPDYRSYAERVLAGESAISSREALTAGMKQSERIALLLRTNSGVPAEWLSERPDSVAEFVQLGLVCRRDENIVVTEKGRLLVDELAEAFV